MDPTTSITAVILAGGLGTRLRSIVADRPKPLAMVQGRPFLAYLLDLLSNSGISTAVLCTGYLGHHIAAAFGNMYGHMSLAYSQEPEPLGTGGALRLALPLISTDSTLVMNGDSYCRFDLPEFWRWHCDRNSDATLFLTQVSETSPYGRVQVDDRGRVLNFEEKDTTGGPGWASAGIYLLSRRLLMEIPERTAISLERELFPTWIQTGLHGFHGNGSFIDIGTPQTYKAAEDFFPRVSTE